MVNQRFNPLFVLLFLAIAAPGCQSMKPWGSKDDQQEQEIGDVDEPRKMVALWSDSVYLHAGANPTRGLGGRIYFYNDSHQPIEADGKLVVYAFQEDSQRGDEQRRPDRKYVFEAEQFAKHVSHSEFGPSYSVWIPWDEVGGEEETVSVIPVFTDANGKVIHGEYAKSLLAGKSAKSSQPVARRTSRESGVRRVSYESELSPEEAEAVEKPKREVKTTDIELSPSLRRRLMQLGDRTAGSRAKNATGNSVTPLSGFELLPRPVQAESTEPPANAAPRSRRLPSRSP